MAYTDLQTFAAVLLFQISEGLYPTGEVDAVTLDRLEPLVPPNYLLAKVMEFPSRMWENDSDSYAWWVKQSTAFLMFSGILLLSSLVHLIARNLAKSTEFLSHWVLAPTSSSWFGTLKDCSFFTRMAHFVPAIFICLASGVFPSPGSEGHDPFPYLDVFERWHLFVLRIGMAYIALTATLVANAYIDACHVMFASDRPKDNPIEGIIGAARRTVTVVGVILILAGLTGSQSRVLCRRTGRNHRYSYAGIQRCTSRVGCQCSDCCPQHGQNWRLDRDAQVWR